MTECPNCHSQQPDAYVYCDQCGARLQSTPAEVAQPPTAAQPDATMVAPTCPNCGAQVMPGQAFCDHCSAPLGTPVPVPPPQTTTPAPIPPVAAPTPVAGGVLVCPNPSCGAQLEPGSKFCDMCGTQISGASAPSSQYGVAPGYPPPLPRTCKTIRPGQSIHLRLPHPNKAIQQPRSIHPNRFPLRQATQQLRVIHPSSPRLRQAIRQCKDIPPHRLSRVAW